MCAGTNDADDYFDQICDLARTPVDIMKDVRDNSHGEAGKLSTTQEHEMTAMFKALDEAGFNVWHIDKQHSQIFISVCAGSDGKWITARPDEFSTICDPSGRR